MAKLVAFIIAIAPSISFASFQTNLTLTPTEAQHDLRIGLQNITEASQFTFESFGAVRIKKQTLVLDAEYQYGLIDNHTIGVSATALNFKETTSDDITGDSELKASGLEKVTLRYQGKGEINDLNLYWSFAFLHGPEASTVDYDAGKASPTLPQNYLSFRGGGFVPTGFGLVGVLLEYQAGQESRQEETLFGVTETFVIKKNDRYITEIHAEWDHPYHPSLTLVHQRIEHGESISEDGTVATILGHSEYGVRFMSRFQLNPRFELIPSLTMMKLQKMDPFTGRTSQKIDTTSFGVLGRMTF